MTKRKESQGLSEEEKRQIGRDFVNELLAKNGSEIVQTAKGPLVVKRGLSEEEIKERQRQYEYLDEKGKVNKDELDQKAKKFVGLRTARMKKTDSA